MFYLRLDEHEKRMQDGSVYTSGCRAVYKDKNIARFYRSGYPRPQFDNIRLYKAKRLKTILDLRDAMHRYCGEWFDVFDETGKIDIKWADYGREG